MRNEGHPVLWYFLLYLGSSIVDTPLILPIVSVTIAFAAAAVFLFRSPFPLWLQALFVLSPLPLYDYSVMARNYGISMLLFFAAAALYRERDRHGLWLAFVLALLANTNVHSAILVGFITVLWAWDMVTRRKAGYVALAIIVAGLALCAWVSMPGRDSIVTDVYSTEFTDMAGAARVAALDPSETFSDILPPWLPSWARGALLYLAVVGLIFRSVPFVLAAWAAFVGLGIFFIVAYPGFLRHQGVFLIFLLFLYWLAMESSDAADPPVPWRIWLFRVGLYGALPLLIVGNVFNYRPIYRDLTLEMTSNKAFGAFLEQSETYRNAIIVAEPAYFVESLPYYATNAIYLPREHRFGTRVSFGSESDAELSLGKLVSEAHALKEREGRPVLIVLGGGGKDRAYGEWSFTWTVEGPDEVDRRLVPVTDFHAALSDENYDVFAVK